MLINNAVITGSFIVNGVDVTGITGSSAISSSYLALSSSYVITSASYAQSSASLSIRTSNLEATSSTLVSASSSFAASSASVSVRVTNLEATSSVVSSSFATTSGSIAGRVSIVEGQDATTGSNVFTGTQYVSEASNAISFTSTASLYTDGGLRVAKSAFISGTAYFNDVVVYGTSSIEYITSSQVNIGSNIITVNTDTPAIRFGGLSVFDSGSTGLTGSIFWDSEKNHWIYSNPSGSSYNSAMLMNGPRNTGSLGDEQGTLSNYIMKGQGGDHITSSQIIDDGTTVSIPGNLQVTGSTVLASALSGTSATFSGNNHSLASNNTLRFTDTDTATEANQQIGKIEFYSSDTSTPGAGVKAYIGAFAQDTTPDAYLSFATQDGSATPDPVERLRISSEGAATFSSIIGVNGASEAGWALKSNGNAKVEGTNGTTVLQVFDTTTGGKAWSLISAGAGNAHSVAAGTFYLRNSTDSSTALQITSTGAATFASSITAAGGSLINANNGTLSADILTIRGGGGTGNFGFKVEANNGEDIFYTDNFTYNIIANLSGGKFGIGTSSPASKLSIGGTQGSTISSNVALLIGNSGAAASVGNLIQLGLHYNPDGATPASVIGAVLTSTAGFTKSDIFFATRDVTTDTAPTERMRITSGGELLIRGTYNPYAATNRGNITLNGTSNNIIAFTNNSTAKGYIFHDGTTLEVLNASGGMVFYTNSVERLTITSGGNLNFNYNNTGAAYIHINQATGQDGAILFQRSLSNKWQQALTTPGDNLVFYSYAAVAEVFKINGDGSMANPSHPTTANAANVHMTVGGTFYRSTSSLKYKNTVTDYDKGLDIVNQLRPVYYKGNNDGDTIFAGLIAEEVHDLGLTEFVQYAEDGTPDALAYSHMVALLTKAIQELKAEINELKNK